MVARLMQTEPAVRITPENHPENRQEPVAEPKTTFSLASTVALGSLCSLVGMTVGSAAFSTSQLTGDRWEIICLIPLVATLCALFGGWVGAFFHMVRSDSQNKPH